MTVEQFRQHIADGLPVENGSEAHLLMHQMSQEALRITAEINGKYHEPAEPSCCSSAEVPRYGSRIIHLCNDRI